jgi:hypothetical protein
MIAEDLNDIRSVQIASVQIASVKITSVQIARGRAFCVGGLRVGNFCAEIYFEPVVCI